MSDELEMVQALDAYVLNLHPVCPGEYGPSDIVAAFKAGYAAGKGTVKA